MRKTFGIGEVLSPRKNLVKRTFSSGVKKLGMDSLSDNCTLWLELVKEYNSQVQFSTWGVDVDLSNLVKNQVCNFSLLSFIWSTLIILLVIVFNWIKSVLFVSINGTSNSLILGVIIFLILE